MWPVIPGRPVRLVLMTIAKYTCKTRSKEFRCPHQTINTHRRTTTKRSDRISNDHEEN